MTTTNNLPKCRCGCALPVNPKSTYRPGHDAKHVSRLLAVVRETGHIGPYVQDLHDELPSAALKSKFMTAVQRLVAKAAPAPANPEVEIIDAGTIKVGRWEYPLRQVIQEDAGDGAPMVNYERNTKRDGSGSWVACEAQ